MRTRLEKTLARQGARWVGKKAYHRWEKEGMTMELAERRSAAEALVCVPHWRIGYRASTINRGRRAVLKDTGWMPGEGDYGVKQRI